MELAELETVININRADLKAGFFIIGTSEKRIADKIQKRAGQTGIVDLKTCRQGDKVTYWDFKVRSSLLASNLGIKLGNTKPRVLSKEQKERLLACRRKVKANNGVR